MAAHDQLTSRWLHEKTEARAQKGMVAARHPISAEAGRAILAKGGNAVDAAVAASLAGSIVQQVANSIGGGGVMLIAHPEKGSAAINYLYQAPAAARPDMYPLEANAAPGLFGWTGIKNQLNEIGGLAVGIPGSIAGLHLAVHRFGRLPWSEVVAPALRLAREGYPVDWYNSLMLAVHADQMQAYPNTARQFLREGVYAYRPAVLGPADLHKQPALAETLEAIARNGPDAFYKGPVAASIAKAVHEAGGILVEADLAGYRAHASAPRRIVYRGHRIEHLAQGAPTMAQFFNTLSSWDMAALRPRDPKRLHLLIEAFRRAWYHRGLYNGDDTHVSGPWSGLASSGFAAANARAIDPQRRTPIDKTIDPYAYEPRGAKAAAGGAPAGGAEGTTHISAADSDGCMVALTETVVGNYGCLVTSETGVLLNNGMIAFAPIPGQPNSIAPGKRPATNMAPLLVFDSRGAPLLTLGASGGRKIMPAVAQILNLVLDHGLGIQDAVAHPRFDLEGDKVLLDSRFGDEVAQGLRAMGHEVHMRTEDLSTFEFGNACAVLRAPDGTLCAGVNPFQMTFAAGLDD